MLTLRLLDSPSTIKQKILRALAEDATQAFARARSPITRAIQLETPRFFRNTSTYESLANGSLISHFGFRPGEGRSSTEAIIAQIAKSITVTTPRFRPFGGGFSGKMTVGVLRDGFEDLLSMGEATITTEKGQLLPWLEWLVIRGNQIIVSDYNIKFIRGGRSGSAIMVNAEDGFWRVPPEHAGTLADNWLTRALLDDANNYVDFVGQTVKREVEKVM